MPTPMRRGRTRSSSACARSSSRAAGTFESVDAWGRLKLAYEIDHKGEAFYHIVNFTSSTETLDEVTRVLRITDDVMRHMVVRRTGRSHGKQAEDQAPVS